MENENLVNAGAADDMTKHERRELKKQQKEKEVSDSENYKRNKEKKKLAAKYLVLGIIILLVVLGMYKLISNVRDFRPYYEGEFHWHANFEVFMCGERQEIKCGSSLCGIMLTHHHNDNIIHTEGSSISKKEDVALGKFFDRIGITFSDMQIMDKKNGDLCSGKAGRVKLVVNGKENTEFREYIPSRCNAQNAADIREKCDKIEVRFE